MKNFFDSFTLAYVAVVIIVILIVSFAADVITKHEEIDSHHNELSVDSVATFKQII